MNLLNQLNHPKGVCFYKQVPAERLSEFNSTFCFSFFKSTHRILQVSQKITIFVASNEKLMW